MQAAQATLDDLLAEIRACRICQDAPRFGAALPHEPRPVLQAAASARICLAGQAPGLRAHNSGQPFTDASGDRLRLWLGLSEAEFYDAGRVAIAPMGFCFPGYDAKGGDMPPRRECAPLWRPQLMERLPNIEVLVLIGGHAQRWHLQQRRVGLSETVADWRALYDRAARLRIIPLPHPSWRNTGWLKQRPWFEAELLPTLQAEIRRAMSGLADAASLRKP